MFMLLLLALDCVTTLPEPSLSQTVSVQSHTRLLSTNMAAHGVSRGQNTIVLIEDQYV